MRQVSVAKLIESAVFNDAATRDETTMQTMEWKFDELFEGDPAFIESVQKHGIQSAIIYSEEENTVYTGHHRVLCAWLLNIEYIDFFDGIAGEDSQGRDEFEMHDAGWPTLFPEEM
jgi:hypothetical protein